MMRRPSTAPTTILSTDRRFTDQAGEGGDLLFMALRGVNL